MVIYDQWSNMAMIGIIKVGRALREGIRIDRLLFEESREEWAILQENCPLTVYLQMVAQFTFTKARSLRGLKP